MSDYLWRKLESSSDPIYNPEKLKKVLVLYTGGTIGMKWTKDGGYQIENKYLQQKVKTYPGLCDPDYHINMERDWVNMGSFSPIPLPCTFDGFRILYTFLEYCPLMDSSSLSMEDWARFGQNVHEYYHLFNGFVILHGTDTMAYTASALSFMFEDLGKTVILTGSQVPISELRNDARDNILSSLILAGQYVIPEVCIFFHNKLYRGNRAVKIASGEYEAFSSPNLPPLASVGTEINVEWEAIHRPVKTTKFSVFADMNRNVGILRIFPGITRETIKSFLQVPMEGVILQTYGAGNVPDTDAHLYLFQELNAACDRGVIIVNCTQCSKGVVKEKYTGGIKLAQVGVISGMDMTVEAALTKLSYLLAGKLTTEQIKEEMKKNLRGELTLLDSRCHQPYLKNSKFLSDVASALNISSSKEVKTLKTALFPPLMCAAAASGNSQCLQELKQQGGDFNTFDYDGRTPLHLACCEGHLETVHYLLENGASVHTTDRFGQTPLDNADTFKKKDVIQLLLQTGAERNLSNHYLSPRTSSQPRQTMQSLPSNCIII